MPAQQALGQVRNQMGLTPTAETGDQPTDLPPGWHYEKETGIYYDEKGNPQTIPGHDPLAHTDPGIIDRIMSWIRDKGRVDAKDTRAVPTPVPSPTPGADEIQQ